MALTRHLMVSTALALAFGFPAAAQQGTAAPPEAVPGESPEEDQAGRRVLETVVVKASRRETVLQDVPVSVSVVTGEDIRQLALQNLDQLSAYVPSLSVSEGGEQTSIAIRGFGSGPNFGFDQSVGMFIDGVYAGRERQFRTTFLDIGAVEVLRGPQAALFGKNTTSGAIIISTEQPTQDFSAYIYGQYTSKTGLQYYQAVLNGGLTDTLSARLAVKYSDQEGHIRNTFTGEREEQEQDLSGRLTLLWTPTDNLSIRTKLERSEYKRDGRAFIISQVSGLETGIPRITDGLPVDTDITARLSTYRAYDPNFMFDNRSRNSKQLETADVTSNNAAIRIDYTLANDFRLTSITGYSAYESDDQRDIDWTPMNFLYEPITQEFNQYSQEFQLLSPSGKRFEYLLGAHAFKNDFYVDRRTDVDINVFLLPFGALPFDPAPFGGPADIWRFSNLRYLDQETKSYSIYGSGTFHFNDQWSVTAGLRYNKEDKTSHDRLYLSEFGTSRFLDPDNNPADAAQIAAVSAVLGDDIARSLLEARVGEELTLSEDDWSPEATLSWKMNENATYYARVTQGHKGGGFNAQVTGSAGNRTFEPEKVTAYEIGGKLKLLGNTASVNFAAFLQDYENQQMSVWNGEIFDVGNAGTARSQGLEADGRWLIGDRLEVTGSFAWIDARYIKDTVGACSLPQRFFGEPGCGFEGDPAIQDLVGKRFAPTISATAGAGYVIPAGEKLEILLRGDVTHFGRNHSPTGAQDPTIIQDSKTLVDFGATLRPVDTGWSLGFLLQNLTDEEFYWYEFEAPGPQIGTRVGYPAAPRRITLRAYYSF